MKERLLLRLSISFLLGILLTERGSPPYYIAAGCWLLLCVWIGCGMRERAGTEQSDRLRRRAGTEQSDRLRRRAGTMTVTRLDGSTEAGSGFKNKKHGRIVASVRTVCSVLICFMVLIGGYAARLHQQRWIASLEAWTSTQDADTAENVNPSEDTDTAENVNPSEDADTAEDADSPEDDGTAENVTLTATGVVTKKEEKTYTTVYTIQNTIISKGSGRISAGTVLIYLSSGDYSIGDTLEAVGKKKSFSHATNDGGFDEQDYYYSKGIYLAISASKAHCLSRPRLCIARGLFALRKRICASYEQYLPEHVAGVLGVMTSGEKSLLDAESKELYRRSGISHILAISGLHVSILGMGLYRFLRKRGISYLGSGVLGGSIIVLFGLLSGFELSTKRAVIMFLVLLLGNTLGMAYDSLSALAFSALLLMCENPGCIFQTGFQLSYSAVIAAVVAAPILQKAFGAEGGEDGRQKNRRTEPAKRKHLNSIRKKLAGTFFLSTCIQLVTLPVTLWYFYEFPLYGIVINTLVLPLMGVVLVSGLAGGLLGSRILLMPASLILSGNEAICNFFLKLPEAEIVTGKPKTEWMVVYYLLLAGVLLLLCKVRITRKKAAASLLPVLIALVCLMAGKRDRGFLLCFLDVGQGDGIYVQENGMVFFIDGGSTSEKNLGTYCLSDFLKYHGAEHVDGWFLSHGDEDHTSGLYDLWESGYRVDRLFVSSAMVRDEAREKLLAAAETYHTTVIELDRGDAVETGTLSFTCLYPESGMGTDGTVSDVSEGDRNASSMVLLLKKDSHSVLLGGDLPKEQEIELVKTYPNLHVDLYKAHHHGGNGSSATELLSVIRPVLTVISCAKENQYGHPGAETMARLAEAGSRIFLTMESGQITATFDEEGIRLRTACDGE